MTGKYLACFTTVGISLITACGGGGGGGGSSSFNNSAGAGNAGSSSSGNSFQYKKLQDLSSGDTLDLASRVMVYRETENGGISVLSGQLSGLESILSITEQSNGDASNRVSVNKRFYDTNGQPYSPDFEVSWTIDVVDVPWSIGNALDEYVYWWSHDGTINDTTTITQTDYTALGFGYWIDQTSLAGYLKTEYAAPALISMDFGDNCLNIGCFDDDPNEDILAAVGGDFTQLGDMPTSGTSYMEGKGLALFHTGDVGIEIGHVNHYLAAESDGEIDIDYAAGTITGYLTFDAVFRKEPYSLSWPRLEGWSGGSVQIDGTIDGRTASGTVTWGGENYGSGKFNGAFFGPDGKEFGGVIHAFDDLEDEWSQLIAAFVAEDN